MGKWEIQEEEDVKMKMHLFRKVKIEKDKNGFAQEKKEENSWFGKECENALPRNERERNDREQQKINKN
jgi:hypothetical protein